MARVDSYLSPKEIPQGSLVFIFHHKKPMKTGWWRKVRRTGAAKECGCIYVFEKSFDKNFSMNANEIKNSRIEHGIICMNDNTVKCNDIMESEGDQSYEILACANGIASAIITINNYLLKSPSFNNSYNAYTTLKNLYSCPNYYGVFRISKNGEKFFDLYFKQNPENIDEIESFVQNHSF